MCDSSEAIRNENARGQCASVVMWYHVLYELMMPGWEWLEKKTDEVKIAVKGKRLEHRIRFPNL